MYKRGGDSAAINKLYVPLYRVLVNEFCNEYIDAENGYIHSIVKAKPACVKANCQIVFDYKDSDILARARNLVENGNYLGCGNLLSKYPIKQVPQDLEVCKKPKAILNQMTSEALLKKSNEGR